MMGALLHWALADWQALAHDLGAMGLLKQSTDRAELAADLEQLFTRLYAAVPADGADDAAGVQAAAGAVGVQQQQQQRSLLLSKAGAISFGDFAGVIAALAVKYRFELPPYYTLVIRCAFEKQSMCMLLCICTRGACMFILAVYSYSPGVFDCCQLRTGSTTAKHHPGKRATTV
jgi:hypothetical protein